MTRVYLETGGNPARFWEAVIDGVTITARVGNVGDAGKSVSQSFDSVQDAVLALDSLKADRIRRGYSAVSDLAELSVEVADSVVDEVTNSRAHSSRDGQKEPARRVIHRLAVSETHNSKEIQGRGIALYLAITETGSNVVLHLRLDQPARGIGQSTYGPIGSTAAKTAFWRAEVAYEDVQSAHMAVDSLLQSPEKVMRFLEAFGSPELKRAIESLSKSAGPTFRVATSPENGKFATFIESNWGWSAIEGFYRSPMSTVIKETLTECTLRSDYRFSPDDEPDVIADYEITGVGDHLDVGQHLVGALTKVVFGVEPVTATLTSALERYFRAVSIEAGTFGPAKQLYKLLSQAEWAVPLYTALAVRFEASHRYRRTSSQSSFKYCWCSVCGGNSPGLTEEYPTYPALRAVLPHDSVSGKSMRYISRRTVRELSWDRRNNPRRYCELALELARNFNLETTQLGAAQGESLVLAGLTQISQRRSDREISRDRRNWQQNPDLYTELRSLVVTDPSIATWIWQTLPTADRRVGLIPMTIVIGLLESDDFELQIAAIRAAIADVGRFTEVVGVANASQPLTASRVGRLLDDLGSNELNLVVKQLAEFGTSQQRLAFLEAALFSTPKSRLVELVAATRPEDLIQHLESASPAARAVLLSLRIEPDELKDDSESPALFSSDVIVDTTYRISTQRRHEILGQIDLIQWTRALDLLAVLPATATDPALIYTSLDNWLQLHEELEPSDISLVLMSLLTSRHSAIREIALTQIIELRKFPSFELEDSLNNLGDVQLAALSFSALKTMSADMVWELVRDRLINQPLAENPTRYLQSLIEAEAMEMLTSEQLMELIWWLLQNMPQVEIASVIPMETDLPSLLMKSLKPQMLNSPSTSVVNFINRQKAITLEALFASDALAVVGCQSDVQEWQRVSAESLVKNGVSAQNWIRLMEIDTPIVSSILSQLFQTRTGRELAELISLAIDSDVESVRLQAISRFQDGIEDDDLGLLFTRLAEGSHPDTAALLAARLLSHGLTDEEAVDRFDRQILLSIGTNRTPKEMVFRRREHSDQPPSKSYLSTLKSLSQSWVARDAEWAIAELTRLENQGFDCGITLTRVSGDFDG